MFRHALQAHHPRRAGELQEQARNSRHRRLGSVKGGADLPGRLHLCIRHRGRQSRSIIRRVNLCASGRSARSALLSKEVLFYATDTRVRRVELLLHRVPCDGGHLTPTCSLPPRSPLSPPTPPCSPLNTACRLRSIPRLMIARDSVIGFR